jgi:Ca-activated chloride channel family protein
MTFAYPWVLSALLPALALIAYFLFFQKQPGVILPSLPASSKRKRRLQLVAPLFSGILISLALLLLITALARPRRGDEKLILRNNGIDIIMALDLSGSMQAYDLPKNITTGRELAQALESGKLKNRLESAKNELAVFIKKRPNDRIGLIGFADYAYNFSPPTLDHELLLQSLNMLEYGIIGDATGLASPIASAVKRLDKSPSPRRVLVLFTDGVNTAQHRLTPQQTALLAKEKNVIIYTVGIGGKRAIVINNGFVQDYTNNFDEKMLREIAESTGGKYFHAADQSGLNQVMQEINQLEKTDFEHPRYVEYHEYAPLLALIALAMLMLAVVSKNTIEKTLP